MKNLILLPLVLASSLCLGQEFSFFLGPSYSILPDFTNSFDNTSTFVLQDFEALPDTVFIEQTTRATGSQQVSFKNKLSGRGGFDLHWELNSNFGIETGALVNFFQFAQKSEFGTFNFETINIETLSPNDPRISESVRPPEIMCDRFENINDEIVLAEPILDYRVVDLYLPMKFTFSVWEGDIKFAVGSYISSLLYANRYSESLNLKSEEINEEHVCSFFIEERNDDARENFRRLNTGLTVDFEYRLFGGFSLGATADKRFTSLFSNFGTELTGSSNNGVSPLFFSAKAKYIFNRKASQSADNQ